MRTSATSSDLVGQVSGVSSRRRSVEDLVGATPLIRLQRSGEGRVLLKHEGYQPGGSFFDRVARRVLDRTGARSVVLAGADAFAVSMATLGGARGVAVQVVDAASSDRRVARLLALAGASLHYVPASEVGSAVRAAVAEGAVEVARDDNAALLAALREIAGEVAAHHLRPSLWVLPDFGLDPEDVARALGGESARRPYLELITDDGERRRSLAGPEAARRAQTGQREGILLSPIGAEIVEAAVNAAPEVDGDVVALVPEGGHRYLGWW